MSVRLRALGRTVVAGTITALSLTACASRQPVAATGGPRQQMIFSGPETPTVLADPARALSVTIDKPADVVWNAVKQVFIEFEVPLTVENTTTRQLGNGDFFRTRRFADKAMPQLVTCGAGITGPNAASYRIFMSLLTKVEANARGGTTVSTTFVSSARDMSGGTAADRLPCGSTGALERLLMARVAAIVAG